MAIKNYQLLKELLEKYLMEGHEESVNNLFLKANGSDNLF
jgi:hypothetical protein